VKLPSDGSGNPGTETFSLSPYSAILVDNGIMEFDSAGINPQFMSFNRVFDHSSSAPRLLHWSTWPEPIGAALNDPNAWIDKAPVEQTRLIIGSSVLSQYAWYDTFLEIEEPSKTIQFFVETQRSNGILIYVDGEYVGSAEDHSHLYEGNITMKIPAGYLPRGNHTISILSENFGYSNLVGRFRNSGVGAKSKGITGDVLLSLNCMMGKQENVSLVDGRHWLSYPGLHWEKQKQKYSRMMVADTKQGSTLKSTVSSMWYSMLFDSSMYDPTIEGLFLEMTTGRGHIWLNGNDLGRYWNITQGNTSSLSQKYYFLPADFLRIDGTLNEIIIFDAFGSDHPVSTTLVFSSIVSSETPDFDDKVNYPLACI
jgi:hypothetical protein